MKKPFLHALAAALYIITLVLTVNFSGKFLPEDNLLMPITMLSVLVLSVAVMGYLFLFEPLQLFLDNRRQEALAFFAKVLGIFACFAILFAILVFFV